jgi:hypothetical protein
MGTDYTSCNGEGCPIKEKCYRFNAPKEPLWQSYFLEIPGKFERIDHDNGTFDLNFSCDMFWGEMQDLIYDQLKHIVK